MKSKMTCVAILLAFGFLTAAARADESYKITLGNASKIGSTELAPGDYKVLVGGPKLVLTAVKTGAAIEVAGKVENGDKKFDTTEIHSKKVDGVSHISEIRFGGSKTKIIFD